MHDDSIYDIAGDPRMARLLRDNLHRLADGPPGPLREMADGVLRGHLDLRQAALSDTCGADLGPAFYRFWTDYQVMDPTDRDQLVDRTRDYLDHILDEGQERPGEERPRPRPA